MGIKGKKMNKKDNRKGMIHITVDVSMNDIWRLTKMIMEQNNEKQEEIKRIQNNRY
jgi:hypothetical protein